MGWETMAGAAWFRLLTCLEQKGKKKKEETLPSFTAPEISLISV